MQKAINKREDIIVPFSIVATPNTEEAVSITKGVGASSELQFGQVDVLVSNSGYDRHGESISIDGIDLRQFKKNPVIMWAHDYTTLPIGKSLKTIKENGNLMARAELDWDIDEFANKIYRKILKGSINAVSIGGIVRKWSDDGMVIKELEMVEFSFVPIGAHPEALVLGKDFRSKINQNHIQALKDILSILEKSDEPENPNEEHVEQTITLGL